MGRADLNADQPPEQQSGLFSDGLPTVCDPEPVLPRTARRVLPAALDPRCHDLAQVLGPLIRFGPSSWHFPGWEGLVWDRQHSPALLSRHGLAALSAHPLLRCVSVDRSFYRPVDEATFRSMAQQVSDDFRFVVKAPSLTTDATLRDPATGRGLQDNPNFLDPASAITQFVTPAAVGLGQHLGALVFQLSPLPSRWREDPHKLFPRLRAMLTACRDAAPAAVVAIEVRDASWLTPEFAELLRATGTRYCLGLQDRMPTVEDQLPMLRALWPGPLVCRWNLQRGLRYADAKGQFDPFDRLQAPDLPTRAALARVVAATAKAGHGVFITINNKAEGSAPCSVVSLAESVVEEWKRRLAAPS
jgi:uncharacterized protein YecE (DUF72 family)